MALVWVIFLVVGAFLPSETEIFWYTDRVVMFCAGTLFCSWLND